MMQNLDMLEEELQPRRYRSRFARVDPQVVINNSENIYRTAELLNSMDKRFNDQLQKQDIELSSHATRLRSLSVSHLSLKKKQAQQNKKIRQLTQEVKNLKRTVETGVGSRKRNAASVSMDHEEGEGESALARLTPATTAANDKMSRLEREKRTVRKYSYLGNHIQEINGRFICPKCNKDKAASYIVIHIKEICGGNIMKK